jgi:hypothetical protein
MYWYMIGRMSRFGRYVHSRERSSVAAELAIGSFDFIYIDANHSYEEVREDLRLWFPKVKLGGIIGGHDYGFSAFPGVKQAVDEFCAKHRVKLNVEPQTVWWAEKPLASPPA